MFKLAVTMFLPLTLLPLLESANLAFLDFLQDIRLLDGQITDGIKTEFTEFFYWKIFSDTNSECHFFTDVWEFLHGIEIMCCYLVCLYVLRELLCCLSKLRRKTVAAVYSIYSGQLPHVVEEEIQVVGRLVESNSC